MCLQHTRHFPFLDTQSVACMTTLMSFFSVAAGGNRFCVKVKMACLCASMLMRFDLNRWIALQAACEGLLLFSGKCHVDLDESF